MSQRKQKKRLAKRCVAGTFIFAIIILLMVEMQNFFHKDSSITTMKQEEIKAKKQREKDILEVNRNEMETDKKEDYKEKNVADNVGKFNKTSLEKQELEEGLMQYYEVKPGDSLERICREYFGNITSMDKIMQINQIENKNRIVVGQVLKMWE